MNFIALCDCLPLRAGDAAQSVSCWQGCMRSAQKMIDAECSAWCNVLSFLSCYAQGKQRKQLLEELEMQDAKLVQDHKLASRLRGRRHRHMCVR